MNVDPEAGVSIQELLDKPADEARALCRDGDGALRYTLTRQEDRAEGAVPSYIRIISSAAYREHEIARYENGAIRVLRDGEQQQIMRPVRGWA